MLILGKYQFTNSELEAINNALLYLANVYPKIVSADHLAEEVGLDPKTLQAGFRRQTELTIYHYQINRRVMSAKKDLQRLELSVKQIAFKNGFKDNSHFGKVFKKHTGLTPLQYRLAQLD